MPPPKSPNEALAERIVAQLIEAGLVLPSNAAEIGVKVATGKARIEDWQGWIEQAIDKKARNPRGDAHGQA